MEMLAEMKVMQQKMIASRELMLAKMDANQREMKKGNNEKFEILRDTLVSRMGAHQDRMMACLGHTEATDLEVNSAESEFVAEDQKALKEEAAVRS
jgi:hypothetical protein